MKKLVLPLIMLLGVLLIACNAVILLSYYFPQWFPNLCFSLSMIFGITLSEVVMLFPWGATSTVNLVVTIIGIVCGLGIVLTNRVFRTLVIILAGLKIIALIGIRYILFKIIPGEGWQTSQIIWAVVSLAVPIAYIIFLTRSSVKQYFAQSFTIKTAIKRIVIVLLIVSLSLAITVFANTRPFIYKSKDLGVSLMIPRDWEIFKKDEPVQRQDAGDQGYQENYLLIIAVENPTDIENSPMIMLNAGKYFDPNGSLKPLGGTFDSPGAAQGYVDILKEMMNFTLVEEPKKITLDGVNAVTFVADFGETRQIYTAAIDEGTAYILQLAARSGEDFTDNRATFDRVLKSFKFD